MSLSSLLSPAAVFSAMSAALSGYCLFRFYANTAGNQLVVSYLLGAGALLAMADSAWRDTFAAAEAEGQPVPAGGRGQLSTTSAFLISVFITLAGLMCAMTGGFNSFRAGGIMILLTLIRRGLFRGVEIISPLLGGLSAGMAIVIGMTAHPAWVEMIHVREIFVPVVFFALYLILAGILSQAARPAARRGARGDADQYGGRRPEARGEQPLNRAVIWLGGVAALLLPLLLAWIMPWRWASWSALGFLALYLLGKLVPLLVYRSRRELASLVLAIRRGAAFLNVGSVASLGDYRFREIYRGWGLPLPGRDELAALLIISALALSAWLFSRPAPEN
ncbi:MAG: hypothetical protein LBU23_02810 [Planctomycetota bacterium]|jgi:hypothetical protein|nr:hypothetical protein [Planctomycetota bacterium]